MSTKPAYRALESDDSDEHGEFIESDYSDEDRKLSGNNLKTKISTISKNANFILISITLLAAVLALVVALVSVGLSTALNSNSDLQSLTVTVVTLQLRLNQSMNTIEYLGYQISAHQTNAEKLYSSRHEKLENLDLELNQSQSTAFNSNFEIQSLTATVNDLQSNLDQSVHTTKDLGNEISTFQANQVTLSKFGVLNQTMNSLQDTIHEHSNLLNEYNSKGSISNPATSCSEIPTDRPSGDYWILKNSSPLQVYCDMDGTFSNTSVEWMRIANLDMTDSNQQCPDGFVIHNRSTAPRRTCSRPGHIHCIYTNFPVHGFEYSRVCGRVIGYQFGSTDAFLRYYDEHARTINDNYVDGVSLTHGKLPRKHVWTFAAAHDEEDTRGRLTCPCTQSGNPYTGVVPPFIGRDYFCDTGSRNRMQYKLYSDDPLWDGQGCGDNSTCCSFNNPPWFCKQLPQPTTDDIEMRVCLSNKPTEENILLERVDIVVH